MKKLPISILIPTMNRPESLRRTLDGLVKNPEAIPAQIVVVDQSQGPLREKTLAVLDSFREYTAVDDFYQETPSSTIARNTAFSKATQEILVYCDDDIDVHTDTLTTLWELMKDPSIAMVAGLNDLSKESKSKIGYLLGEKDYFRRKTGHVTSSILGRFPVELGMGQTDTMWAMGFFFAIRKSLALKYGSIWDTNLVGYAYAEDLDYSLTYAEHAKTDGLRCIFDGRIHVSHLGSLEYRVSSEKYFYAYAVNRLYLSYKHGYGVSSRMAIIWCDFWKWLHRLLKRNQPGPFRRAGFYAFRMRKQLKQGIVIYPDFLK